MFRFFLSIIHLIILTAALTLSGNFIQAQNIKPTQFINDSLAARIDAKVKPFVDKGFSGAVLIAKGKKVILKRNYGLADRTKSELITENTVFNIGSLAKQFTAAAILKLEMSGKLNVQDLISKYLDGVPEDKQAITIHQLLTQTSGLPREYNKNDYDPANRDEMIDRVLQLKLKSLPGTAYSYSNVGYLLLGAIIERVSKQPFEQFLRDTLFKPAKMSKTGYFIELRKHKDIACGYEGSFKGTPLDEPVVAGSWFRRGSGGILSTAADLYRWHLALKSDAILSAKAKQKLFSKHIRQYSNEQSFYGYGWVVTKTNSGTNLVWHNGGWFGFHAEMQRYMDEDIVVIFLTNQPGKLAEQMQETLLQTLFST